MLPFLVVVKYFESVILIVILFQPINQERSCILQQSTERNHQRRNSTREKKIVQRGLVGH